MEQIDRKFRFVAVNPVNGKVYTEDNAVVFVAKDKAVPAMLQAYKLECARIGTNSEHIISVGLLQERVERYQADVESRVPDTVGGEIARCIEGKGL